MVLQVVRTETYFFVLPPLNPFDPSSFTKGYEPKREGTDLWTQKFLTEGDTLSFTKSFFLVPVLTIWSSGEGNCVRDSVLSSFYDTEVQRIETRKNFTLRSLI